MPKALLDREDLKLGLFAANCSGAMTVTTVDERWQATWDDNLRMVKLGDAVGIDFVLPVARWIGYGGQTNFHGGVLDPVVLASAMLAVTERIVVFATIHTAFNHPLVAAKAMATADQIGKGRAGLNIVAGWNQPEYEMMGLDLPQEHDARYAYAQEWWDVVRQAWSEPGPLDIEGRFWQLKGVESDPKPYDGLVPILNAGSSPQGRDFAARNSDVVFTVVADPEDAARIAAEVRQNARARYEREVGLFTCAYCVCRPTAAEAEEFQHWYADDHADWDAVDRLMLLQGLHAQSFTKEMLATLRPRFAAGHGLSPLVGSPDDVAQEIARYWHAGFGGVTLSFFDYVDELDYFAQEVLPRLERLGIRRPR